MAVTKLNKNEMRTRQTRELLLQAALQIFVRDGYEQAELGEIAKLAGRTKGAIYAHFKSKEDIFLTLVADHALQRRAVMQERLAASRSVEENLAAFRKTFLEFSKDEAWALLLLEFRLYTIRHPEEEERLREMYDTLVPRNDEATFARLLGAPKKGKDAISRTTAVHAGFAMLSALQLEAKFNQSAVSNDAIEKIANRIFDALLDVSPSEK